MTDPPKEDGMQSFNVTFWLGGRVEVFSSLNKELRTLVWEWMRGRCTDSKTWVTGRFLFGTEALIHPGSEPDGDSFILQFCGDIPPEQAVVPTVLIETLTDLARCVLLKLDLTYARIRIGTTDLEEGHIEKPKSAPITAADEPPPKAPVPATAPDATTDPAA